MLLAGDVAAAVIGGNLVITGDAAGNEIVIDQDGLAAGQFRIRSGADATTVNGEAEVIVSGVTGDVRANLRGGDDVLEIVDAVVAGDLLVNGRGGDDTVTVTGCDVGGKIVVQDGAGAGTVGLTGSDAGGDVSIVAGAGGIAVTVSQSGMAGGFSLEGGRGEDFLDVDEMDVGGSLRIETGASNDSVALDEVRVNGNSSVAMGTGEDLLEFESEADGAMAIGTWLWSRGMFVHTYIQELIVRMGRGDDTLGVSMDQDFKGTDTVHFGGGVHFFGGRGEDLLRSMGHWNDSQGFEDVPLLPMSANPMGTP